MSLDVSLTVPGTNRITQPGIFIREGGETREISESEWQRRFPDREPVRFLPEDITTDEVFDWNITHNLGKMAREAGVYEACWRPDEKGWTKARDLIGPLSEGLDELCNRPEHFRQFNPSNGWGDYEGLVKFVRAYLEACREYPDADIYVSR